MIKKSLPKGGKSKTGKIILVTGGAGFIGSHLCKRLISDGYAVISLDNYFTGNTDNHIDGVKYIKGHTRDIKKLVSEDIDIVYHLGEYSRVAVSIEEPSLVWDMNINGTSAVLEYCREKNCKLIYAGSSTKFSKIRLDGIKGTSLSPYTWAKATNTELVKNYGDWYGLKYAITYFYNVYGPGELFGKYGTVIEIFKQKYLRGEPLTYRLPGTQTRNYTHVDDTVEGLVLVGEKGEGDKYGIGSDKAYATKAVAELFQCAIEPLPARKTSRPSAKVNTEKIKKLGWQESKKLKDYIADFLRKNKK